MVDSPFRVGVIGAGFLGTAIISGFSLHASIRVYDKFKPGYDTLEDTVANSDLIFFCLPTPMFIEDGSQDLSILEGAVASVHDLTPEGSGKVAIIKSTVLPGTNRKFQEKFPKLHFVSCPEFLTARNNRLDFICASRNILGGEVEWVEKVDALYKHRFGNSLPTYKVDFETAETVKYTANCFFALKVSYFNFIYDLCQKIGIKYEDVKDLTMADGRIGRSHADVGVGAGVSDCKRGWGGMCFPKDLNAFKHLANKYGIDPKLLDAAWEQNLEDRPEKDWEQIPGVISHKK